MNPFRVCWGLGILVCGWASAQPGQVSPDRSRTRLEQLPPILRFAVRSAQTVTFSGTRIVEQWSGPVRQRHTEYVLRSGNRLRIWFPTDSEFAGQVIVETPRVRQHYFPGKNEIHVSRPHSIEAFGRLIASATSKVASYAIEPGGVIAGQETNCVAIREEGNLTQKLWIDRKTGMILRRDLFDPVGAKVGSYTFTEIDYSPTVRAGDFELNRKGARIVTPEDEARALARRHKLLLAWLPIAEGWRLESARTVEASAIPVIQLTYSKGTTFVSLFQAKGRVKLPMLRRARQGVLGAYTWSAGGNTFALIGNLKPQELERLASLVAIDYVPAN